MSSAYYRDDVDPKFGEREYGDVEFADAVNNKYPIDSEGYVRATWGYINEESSAAKYDGDFNVYKVLVPAGDCKGMRRYGQ